MFAYIKGTVTLVLDDYAVVENNGIGYMIFMPSRDLDALRDKKDVLVYTYYYVREDNISLYGFLDKESLNIFKLLLGVSGVGPKAALSILSCTTPSSFILSVVTKDDKTLSKAQGIGKKLAQRIILELKDKFKDYEFANEKEEDKREFLDKDVSKEAIAALLTLGYTKQEAIQAVKRVEGASSVEDYIKGALKFLMK
ncbi:MULTISPECIES: Holliday junction branch migration protein RuvA [Caloramator]|uniref:Holliday junction branch migration complex subunit RuvA n=1 Tax=Caloramator australicus RC3 TaxID=857293 RepID=I7J6Q0_9CLOT|nr:MULTISPECIES: Holliday junction branch migration protein RuvA [Caloramator]MDO6355642.1 Holliday junction branch migration protein RuvA [Caloramator sp. CAR-1]WDU84365.1 Holliday junction branch migration protein RuvA [Caloramator sp. Dgby_cultured_2]CCJ34694.1 Holliday junction DNA helicase RuvA [Caloramator australicus RC3]